MQALLLVAAVAAILGYGYFLMARLGRFLEGLPKKRELSEEEPSAPSAGVENTCFLCYNRRCEHRVRQPGAFPGKEGPLWNSQSKTLTGCCGRSGNRTRAGES